MKSLDTIIDEVTASTNPVDAAIDELTADEKEARRRALLSTGNHSPDELAEAKRIGKVLNLPSAAVATELPKLRTRARLDEIDSLIDGAPVLARKLGEPEFAGVARDDAEAMRQIEHAANFKPTINGADVSMLIDEALKRNPALDWDTARANVLKRYNVDNLSTGLLRTPQQPTLTPESFVRGLVVGAKNLVPKIREEARLQFAGNLGLKEMEADAQRRYEQFVSRESLAAPEFERGDTLARYAYGGAQSVLTNVPGLTLAVLTRNPYVALTPAVAQTELDQYARTRTRGGTVGEANLAGALSGAVEGATELYPMKFLVDSIGRRTLMQIVVGDQIREQFGEQIATHMQDAIDTAIANPTKTWKDYWKERPDAAAQTVVAVLMQSAVVATAGVTANTLAGKTDAAIRADQYAQDILRLSELNAASKVLSRDPESLQQFIAESAEEGPVQDVWVNPQVLMQSGVDVQAIAQASPSFAEQLDDALQNGGEVRIPVAEFATALPGTGFEQAVVPHLRTDPDAMTQAEAQVFMQSQAEEFQREAETLLAKVEERSAFDISAQVVEESLMSQLKIANRFTEDVNREYAKIARAVFSSAAARMNVTPEEAYKKFALQVRAQQIAAQYDQKTGQLKTETPEFKAWFGDSKVVDAEGKPLVLYHSTTGVIESFRPRTHVGTAQAANDRAESLRSFSAEVVGRDVGSPNVLPVLLSIQNPLRLPDLASIEEEGHPRGWEGDEALSLTLLEMGLIDIDEFEEHRSNEEAFDLLAAKGYDGIVYRNVVEDAGKDSYIAFRPEQIKSVFNRGTFDPNDPNILNQSAATTEAQTLVDQHTPELIEEYFTRFGNIIDPDNVKQLFPAYVANPSLAAAVHEPSSQLAKAIYVEALKRNKGAPVVFTAGGGGSGKTEALSLAQDLLGGVGAGGLIYDSTLSSFDSAVRRIDAALASGSEVDIVYTNREVGDAFIFAMRRKRVVPLSVLAEAHVGASNVIRQLAEHYASEPRVQIQVVNNLGEIDDINLGSLADVPVYEYDAVERRLHELARGAFEAGRISEERYAALTASAERASGEVAGEVQGGEQGQDLGGPVEELGTLLQSSAQQPTTLLSRITSLDEFDTSMLSFLRKDGWLIITATAGGDPYSEANVAANRTLEEDLKARGLPYRAGEGYYLKAPQGTSFLVQGDEALGIELAKKYKQESVLTKDGYIYQDGSLTPVDHTKDTFGEEAKQQDGYTVIGDKAFSLGLDFSQRVHPMDRPQPSLPFAVHGIQAVHYSKVERNALDGHWFGEGLKGAERERLRDADPRLRVRTAFYVSNGRGVFPEAGVGNVAHLSTLNNLYDADADPLHIWDKPQDANTRELAVIEAGYAGYLGRDTFDRQGTAVIFGRSDLATVKVDDPNAVAEVPPPPKISEVQRVRRAFATDRRFPAGQMSRAAWGEYARLIEPSYYDRLAPFGVFEGEEVVYRDELLRTVLDQSAYHGTRVKGIRKFSTAFIGTGEGAAAYGWGLYFAGDKAIAEFYREQLTSDRVPIKTFYLGARPVVRNSEFIDYSPRQGHDRNRENVWGTLAEGLLADEQAVREAAEKGQLTEHVLSELDGLIERYKTEWPEGVQAAQDLRRTLARPGAVRFELEPVEQGQVYKVELPEHDEFLDWDKPLSGQSKGVRDAVREAWQGEVVFAEVKPGLLSASFSDGPVGYFTDKAQAFSELEKVITGRQLYQTLERKLSTDKAASTYLNSLGIPGIRYLDAGSRSKGEGTHNYVVFDDNAIKILEEYYQEEKSPRGQISFGTDITQQPSIISLLQQADLTTFIHELGHFQLEVLASMAAQGEATAQRDMQTLLDWFGVADLATWNGLSLEEKRPYHEQLARGFEAYTLEGKAPSIELQGTFARIRAWMLNIYKNLTQLNVQLTDEVRGVFDRMLATEQQIAESETQRGYAALFESAAAAGMTAEEWAEYQTLGAQATEDATAELQARSVRNMRWLSNAKSRALKALQKDATAKYKAVETEVREEVRKQPVYAARRFLAYGELGPEVLFGKGEELTGKLDLGALKAMYGEGPAAPWRYLPTGEKGLAASEGLHPDTVAEMFGFTSGDHLVRELIGAEQEAVVVEGLTDQRMLERYGDLTTPEGIERAAEKAIHNEARVKFVAMELNALARATGQQRVLLPAAREFAARTVARQPIRKLKPTQYAAAEGRAARAAAAALKSGNTVEAAVEKRNQLVNSLTAKAATEAAADIESGVVYLKKFDREGTRKKIDIDYLDQIDAILERFDLRTGQSLTAIDKRKSLASWITQQEAMGLEPSIPEDLRNEAFRKHYKDLTVEEFRGLIDSIRNIEHLGRLKTKLLTAVRQREFAAAVDEIVTSIEANAKGTVAERRSSDRGRLVDVAQLARNFLADHRKFASLAREMDGWQDGGVMWEYLVRGMNAAGDKEAAMREQATIKLSELLKPILKAGGMGRKTYFPKIGKSFTREERIGIALNMGNEVNRERVMTGEKLSPVQLQSVLDTITPEEGDFVQAVWEFFESYRPQIAEKQRRLTGTEPEWVQPSQVFLGGKYREGGYYPIAYDPLRSSRAEADTAAEVQRQIERGLYVQAQTRRGHLKARVDSTGRPLRYDLGVIVKHVDQVVHDLAWHEFLIDANRLLRNGRVDGAIREHYGPEKLAAMKETLRDIAIGDMAAQGSLDHVLNHLRHGATIVGMGWRVTTSLLQPLGLTQSIVRIGPRWVARGMRHWAGDTARLENSVRLVGEKSTFMRLRAKTLQREINEIRNKVQGTDSRLEASYFWLIQKMQLVADLPTWWGAYEKAMSEDGMVEERAIALADQAVIDAQGSGQIKDLSAVQRGGAGWKLFTTFYNFFNTTYQLTAESIGRTNFKSPTSIALLGTDLLLLYTVPAILGTLMKAALSGDWEDEDKLLRRLAADQIGYLTGTMVLVREGGGLAQNVIDPQHAFDYQGPASLRFMASVSKLAKQIGQGEADEAFWRALNETGGTLFHYPAGQINATLDGINAMAEGKTENPGVLIVGHQDR